MRTQNRPLVVGAANISSIDFTVPLMWKNLSNHYPKVAVIINGSTIKKNIIDFPEKYLFSEYLSYFSYRKIQFLKKYNKKAYDRIQYFIEYLCKNLIEHLCIESMTVQSLFLYAFYHWVGIKDVTIIDLKKPLMQNDVTLKNQFILLLKEKFFDWQSCSIKNGRTQLIFKLSKKLCRCRRIKSEYPSLSFFLENGTIYKIPLDRDHFDAEFQEFTFHNATGELSSLFLENFGRVAHCPWYLFSSDKTSGKFFTLNFDEFITPYSLIDLSRIDFRKDYFIPARSPGAFLWDYLGNRKQVYINKNLNIHEPLWAIEILSCFIIKKGYNEKKRERRARLSAQVLTSFYYKILHKYAHKIFKIDDFQNLSNSKTNIIFLIKFISLILLYRRRYNSHSIIQFKNAVQLALKKNNIHTFDLLTLKIINIAEALLSQNYSKTKFTRHRNKTFSSKLYNRYETVIFDLKNEIKTSKKNKPHSQNALISKIYELEYLLKLILTKSILNMWDKMEKNCIASPLNIIPNLSKEVIWKNLKDLSKSNLRRKKTISINLKSVRCKDDSSKSTS